MDRNRQLLDVELEVKIQVVVGVRSKQLLDVEFEENIQALGIVVDEARSTDQQRYQLHKPLWVKQLADCDSHL